MTRQLMSCLIASMLWMSAIAFGQSSLSQHPSTIKANTNLVVVDVVVSDSQHAPVHKLKAEDFTVLENGKPQTISSFEEHSPLKVAAPLPARIKFPPGTFTNYTEIPSDGTLNVVLIDRLNTPMTGQVYVREQMMKFLNGLQPGSRIAIFGLTTRLILLQGFTSDPAVLKAILNGKKGLAKGSVGMDDQVNGDHAGDDDPMIEAAQDTLGNNSGATELIENLKQMEAEFKALQLQIRTQTTLDAFNQLARYLGGLPGRKNVIWFSGSFPISLLPDPDIPNPFSVVGSRESEFRETVDLLTRSQVAVYPVDANGLVTPSLNLQSSGAGYVKGPNAFVKDQEKDFEETAEAHGTMRSLAEATGGEAYINTNDLAGAVESAVDVGSHYYTLTYSPTDQKWDGKYRKVHVKVSSPGLTLSYRRGYLADAPDVQPISTSAAPVDEVAEQIKTQSTGEATASNSALQASMMRGAPDPTEIVFSANVRPATASSEAGVAPGNHPVGKSSGPYRPYSVLLNVLTGDVRCPQSPDGLRHCDLEAAVFVYDANGALVNYVGGRVRTQLSASDYAARLKMGTHFVEQISVPAKGEYFLRIGIHDETTGKVGAVELPIDAVRKLTPIVTAPTPVNARAPQ